MSQIYRYRSALGTTGWVVDLGNAAVRLGTLEITELAEHLQVGQSTVILDDPSATLGHSSDHILGLQQFQIEETDEDTDNTHFFDGFTTTRVYSRGDDTRPSLRTGASRQIAVTLVDLNAIPTFVMFPNDDTDANRPAETVDDRIAWVLATPYFAGNIQDLGLIESNTTMMSATNYQGQTAANVISDCELSAGFGWNAFIHHDQTVARYGLAFFNANTSTLYESDLRISNDMSDVDTGTVATFTTGTTFYPHLDAELTRDPKDIASGVYLAWSDGTVYRTRTATSDIYGRRDVAVPNTNIRSPEKARDMADDFLFQSSTDDDNISVKIEVPASKVNHIKAGQRLEVKFTHLPGYESFTWCRVIRRTVMQESLTKDRYTIDMDLSPQEAAAPAPGDCTDIYTNTASGTYYPLGRSAGDAFAPADSDGISYYFRGGLAPPTVPTPGWPGSGARAWHFPEYGTGGVGTIDYAGDTAGNKLILMTVGNGTWTIQTEIYGGSPRNLYWATGPEMSSVGASTYFTSGDSVVVTISDATDGDCVRVVVIGDLGDIHGGKWGWSEGAWVAA